MGTIMKHGWNREMWRKAGKWEEGRAETDGEGGQMA
jgi:hypothetical protein